MGFLDTAKDLLGNAVSAGTGAAVNTVKGAAQDTLKDLTGTSSEVVASPSVGESATQPPAVNPANQDAMGASGGLSKLLAWVKTPVGLAAAGAAAWGLWKLLARKG